MLGPPRRSPPALIAVLVLAATLVACGDEDSADRSDEEEEPGLSVSVEPASVEPGETLQARVVNDTGSRYTYGAAYELEREVDGEFEPVPVDKAFIQIAYIVEPDETGPPVAVEAPPDAEPGTWRVILDRDAPGGELAAEFEVSDPGG